MALSIWKVHSLKLWFQYKKHDRSAIGVWFHQNCHHVLTSLSSSSSLGRVSVLTWAVPIWRVWAENSARHSTSPLWRSESAAPRGTTLPRNPPDCQHARNCWLFQRPPGILRSPWPDCPAPTNTKNLCSPLSPRTANHKQLSWMG